MSLLAQQYLHLQSPEKLKKGNEDQSTEDRAKYKTINSTVPFTTAYINW
jgi:hypothetical protein